MFEYGYRKNEWLAVYVDENGDRQVIPFDTFEQATQFLECCMCKIGVMTTSFYNHNIEKIAEWKM